MTCFPAAMSCRGAHIAGRGRESHATSAVLIAATVTAFGVAGCGSSPESYDRLTDLAGALNDGGYSCKLQNQTEGTPGDITGYGSCVYSGGERATLVTYPEGVDSSAPITSLFRAGAAINGGMAFIVEGPNWDVWTKGRAEADKVVDAIDGKVSVIDVTAELKRRAREQQRRAEERREEEQKRKREKAQAAEEAEAAEEEAEKVPSYEECADMAAEAGDGMPPHICLDTYGEEGANVLPKSAPDPTEVPDDAIQKTFDDPADATRFLEKYPGGACDRLPDGRTYCEYFPQ